MNDRFLVVLDELVPTPAEPGDWNGVIARAGQRRSRRRLVIATGAAVALAALAAPALAYLFGLIGRTPSVGLPVGETKMSPSFW